MNDRLQARTIADFGTQWTSYHETDGFFGSTALFDDFFAPLVSAVDTAGRRVAEVGAGTGRFINVLAAAGAAQIIAVEPSAAMRVLRENTSRYRDRITYLQVTGDRLPPDAALDYVFIVGVLHHIPQPDPVMRAAFTALRPGGVLAVWVYGREGNAAYLALAHSLWWLTRRLPHPALAGFVRLLYPAFWCYMTASRWLPLPLAAYMRRVMAPLTPDKRRVVIYDQLNPAYAKYYRREEARDIFVKHGFVDIRLHHRHGMSWTVIGTKPA